ncbi:MAG: YebC/PmpR family DNA-binding transcriptional regulator [Victivallales bacterium]|nr:YebC/PmpR family DNA-binding transcriptional regulator [Victivallales bacterium]
MAGHSKWANIKHKKGAADKKKAKVFSRITKEIFVAVKQGGSDPEMNPALRSCIVSAKAANMPNANVGKAIKKASGAENTANYEEVVYEGYGPDGIGIVVECLTDNRNRTAGEVRSIFDKNGGNMAGSGAVTWMFHKKAYFAVSGEWANEEKLMEVVLDAGAEDIEVNGDVAEIWAPVEAFEELSKAFENAGIKTDEATLSRRPENKIEIKDAGKAKKMLRLIEKFEDNEDVDAVHANFDIADEIMDQIDE